MATVSGGTSNASPPPSRSASAQHTRTYQACIPCRRRKVRCDLGPVDNPHDPPCVRCRRESKECFFSATRRKRKTNDGGEEGEDGELSDYAIRNGRKKMRAAPDEYPHRPDALNLDHQDNSTAFISQPRTPGGSVGRLEPLRRPHTGGAAQQHDDEDPKLSEATARVLQRGEIFSGHDALNLLYEAAGRNGDIVHHRANSSGSIPQPSFSRAGHTPGSQNSFASPQANAPQGIDNRKQWKTEAPVDPAIDDPTDLPDDVPDVNMANEADIAAVQAWSKFRFVKAGWFTAQEAIQYIDYFYVFLSPLTPIVVPDYKDHATHGKLLKEEPMLVITLLMIASRFRHLKGPGGATRSSSIHEALWKFLQGMIDRTIWGQEQFGGGFCGAGQQPGSDVNPLSRKGLRTLGTVESLMLLTEWHPRALHFPPGTDSDELVPSDDPPEINNPMNGSILADNKGPSGQRIDSWLEPCWRSDRMCWMLIGNAMSLAYEIGVFDETSEMEFEEANQSLSHATVKAYYRRKNHLKDLLDIYVTQTSGRLGLTSMIPKTSRGELPSQNPLQLYQERIARIRPPPSHVGMRPDGQRLPFESVKTQEHHAVQDLVLDFWNRIARIMEKGNLELFPNRRQTRDLLKSGKYEDVLQEFQVPMLEWKKSFDQAKQVPDRLRQVLNIEYEYTRVYCNSLALQAVVERCTNHSPLQAHVQPNGTLGGSGTPRTVSREPGAAIPFDTLQRWYGNDRYYINQVVDACRNVLKIVIEGLVPGNALRHAPVRTFFRIVSVAIILLKTFALGSTEYDAAYSLTLLENAVSALRNMIVDDVHVGNRFADLVANLVNQIRHTLVRLAANGSSGISGSNSRAGSPPRAGQQTPLMPPPSTYQQTSNQLGTPFNSGLGAFGNLSAPQSPSLGVTASGRATPNQALWNVATDPYDPSSNTISIMPPPNFNQPNGSYANNFMDQSFGMGGTPGSTENNMTQDWLALPLDPLLNQYGADINQTVLGPDIGGYDMLDVLLNNMNGGA